MTQVVLSTQAYGKDKVRVIKVSTLSPDPKAPHLTRHTCIEYVARVLLLGSSFTDSYLKADNSLVVPTDTVKNTIYVLAKQSSQKSLETPEWFAREIIVHFLKLYPHVEGVDVELTGLKWSRITTSTFQPTDVSKNQPGSVIAGASSSSTSSSSSSGSSNFRQELLPHPHSFVRDGDEKRVVQVRGMRIPATSPSNYNIQYSISSGLRDLLVLKTTGSSFEKFHRCQNTTLMNMSDRIFSTTVEVFWKFPTIIERPSEWSQPVTNRATSALTKIPFDAIASGAKQITLDIFANHNSPSVQATLYITGQVCLDRYPDLDDISFALPNKHAFAVNLKPFNLANEGKVGVNNGAEVFQPLSDPSGLITATIRRKEKAKL